MSWVETARDIFFCLVLTCWTWFFSGHILPGEKAESTFTVTPTKKANGRLIIADVDARQLQDMKQYDYVDVAPADPKPEPSAPPAAPSDAPTTTEIEWKDPPIKTLLFFNFLYCSICVVDNAV